MEAVVVERVAGQLGELVLRQAGATFEVVSNGVFLMDSRDGRSERLLVDAALAAHPAPHDVLIGGLGVGFSLLQALADPRVGRITVAEIEPAVVRWHRGPLAAVTAGALDDDRVAVRIDDIATVLAGSPSSYDVICLDVDNGPDWTVIATNAALYDDHGLHRAFAALRPGGVLSVWSARAVPEFEARLRRHAGQVQVHTVDVARGEPDVVYVATGAVPAEGAPCPTG